MERRSEPRPLTVLFVATALIANGCQLRTYVPRPGAQVTQVCADSPLAAAIEDSGANGWILEAQALVRRGDPAAAFQAYTFTRPGGVGDRNNVRGDGYFQIDTGLYKSWALPWGESHTVQFRWEVFNLTNMARFDPFFASGSLDSADPALNPNSNFGRYSCYGRGSNFLWCGTPCNPQRSTLRWGANSNGSVLR